MFGLYTSSPTTRKGNLDKLNVTVRILGILETKNPKSDYNKFKSYLVSQLKRGITPQEEMNLAQGIVNFIQTDGGTNERLKTMEYLIELEFLEEAE